MDYSVKYEEVEKALSFFLWIENKFSFKKSCQIFSSQEEKEIEKKENYPEDDKDIEDYVHNISHRSHTMGEHLWLKFVKDAGRKSTLFLPALSYENKQKIMMYSPLSTEDTNRILYFFLAISSHAGYIEITEIFPENVNPEWFLFNSKIGRNGVLYYALHDEQDRKRIIEWHNDEWLSK